ncbi:MAG: carboxypeptidase regulatory-like domain-containing protein [Bacteroidetes bacterium]|nr:carboxypeptidase regulatory-like domain-containing protein [Bacteroidota bacterium]
MLKTLSTIVLFICACTELFSQNKTILQGTVKQSDGNPLRNSAVMLIQYNPATKLFSAVDSSYTDANGKYKFDGSMQYFILAKPDVTVNDFPTYYGNSLFSQKATPVSMNYGEAVTADFSTVKKAFSNSGVASLGGTISLGKNLGPVSKATVFLADKDKNPIAVASTNAQGKFEFKNLAMGNYSVWVDMAGVDNLNADVINLNVLNPVKNNFHFQIDDGVLTYAENNYASIKEALANKENVFALNLNSLQHDVEEKSFVIAPDGSKTLLPQAGEFSNLESLSLDINMLNSLPAETGKLGKLTSLSLSLNKLSSLPPEMANLQHLKTLNLGKNNFSKFPDAVTSLSSLEELNLENNSFASLPTSINALKNLKTLNLSGCAELLALPPQIGELANLEVLELSNCAKLKSLPKELNNLKNLKVLDIQGTKLNANSFKKAVPNCEVRVTKK